MNKPCPDCPRQCTQVRFCGKKEGVVTISKVMRHIYEEPPLCEKRGSGAVFFSNCSLKCVYCQNFEISHFGGGKDFTAEELAKLFKTVERQNVQNLNLVTPTHYSSLIRRALRRAKVKIPVVWNTSGYEEEKNIEKLKGLVDIFLFDLKYFDDDLSKRLSKAPNYFEKCIKAIKKAREIVGKDEFLDGEMKKGIIVRHLILPGHTDDSIKIFEKLYEYVGNDIYISIMSQFYPVYKAKDYFLDRTITPLEYKRVLNKIRSLNFNLGFMQELSSCSGFYTPNFKNDVFWEF